MGYYTNFSLTASACTVSSGSAFTSPIPSITLVSLEDEIEKMNVFDSGNSIEHGCYACAKWYDWKEDMSLLSKRFPEILFYLHGEGENYDDLWDAYFLGGKSQYCPAVITYEDFNPDKLSGVVVDNDTSDCPYSYQNL